MTKLLAAIIAVALICALMGNTPPPVEKSLVHTIRPTETLWQISDRYIELNTAERIGMNEFMYRIKKDNPEQTAGGFIRAGDKLTIKYYQ